MAGPAGQPPRAVIVISSHVARGSVGNRAAVFALEYLGHPVWAVPTVILPWHPGHGKATRIVPPAGQFASLMGDLAQSRWLGEVAGVLTGYLGDAAQAGAIAMLVRAVKARNPDAIYMCDPIFGDSGSLYVSEPVALAIRDELLPLADIATPNRFELEWLSGRRLDDPGSTIAAAREAGPATVVVTSAPAMMEGGIGNLLVTRTEALLAEHRLVEKPPKGLGDLTAALLLARLVAGQPAAEALRSTTAAVYEVLARTARRGGDELQLETDAQSLADPAAPVELRSLLLPARAPT